MAAWLILGWAAGKSIAALLFNKPPKGEHYRVLVILVVLTTIDWALFFTK